MATNATSVHNVSGIVLSSRTTCSDKPFQVRANRAANMNNKSFGGAKAWNSNIWGDNNLGNGFDGKLASLDPVANTELTFRTDQHIADTNYEGKSGSGSLLSTSESDGWTTRPNLPWPTVNTSSALSRGSNATLTTSPAQARSNDLSATISEAADATSYFALPRSSAMNAAGPGNHRTYLNSSGDGVSPSTDGLSFGGFNGFRNGENRNQVGASGFGGSPVGTRFPMKQGSFDTSTPDEVATLSAIPQGLSDTLTQQLPRNGYAHMPHNSTSFASQRPAHASHPSFHSETQGFDSRYGNGSVDISAGLSKLQVNDGAFGHSVAQRPAYMSHASYDGSLRAKYAQGGDESNYQPAPGYVADGATDLGLAYQASRSRADGSVSPAELTRMGSPFYPGVDTGSVAGPHFRNASGSRLSEAQTLALERKLRGMQPEAEYAASVANPLQRVQYPPSYDFAGYQAARLNALAGFYQVSPIGGLGAAAFSPRGHRENDLSQVVRSPLLEEFRANSKGNKRYELKVWISLIEDILELLTDCVLGHLQPCGGIQWRSAWLAIHPTEVGNRQQ